MIQCAVLKSCVTSVDFSLPPASRESGTLDKAAPVSTETGRKSWTRMKPQCCQRSAVSSRTLNFLLHRTNESPSQLIIY